MRVSLLAVMAAAVGLVLTARPAATPVDAAGVTTTTAAPATTVVIQQFPVQGLCGFVDTWGAPRSGGRTHQGVDIIARAGLYLYAVNDGTLTKQYIDAPGALAGNGWRLTRADGTYFFYAHLSAFAPGLRVGSTVKAGQIIGLVGMTGNAGTPHLHFEVHPNGGPAVNPTAIVKAVNGCATTVVPPQPVTTPPSTTTPATSPPTTVPGGTVPATTVPPTTPGTTTQPTTTVPTGPAPTTTVPTGPADKWEFISPVRALDTSGVRLTAGATKRVAVGSLSGVPAGVQGVMVRIVARNAAAAGYLAVFPCDTTGAGVSTLSFAPSRLNATMTMAKVVGGEVCLSASKAVEVRLDVVAVQSPQGVGVRPMVAKRALDTRKSTPIAAGGTRSASLSALGAPAGTKAVTLTVTLINPSGAGSIGVGACGGTPWIVAFGASGTQVFSGVIRTNDAGICVSATAQVHVVVDVTGAWTGSQALLPTAPQRLFDSRAGGAITPTGKVVGLALPAGATRAQVTVTIIGGTSSAALLAWNCADVRPSASVAYTTSASNNAVTVTLNVTGGALCVASTANVNVAVDLIAVG